MNDVLKQFDLKQFDLTEDDFMLYDEVKELDHKEEVLRFMAKVNEMLRMI